MLCDYGCGNEAKYKLKNGKNCCSKFTASCPELKKKNSKNLSNAYKTGKRLSAKSLYQSLSDGIKDKMNWAKGKTLTNNNEIFIENSRHANEFVKKRILQDNILLYICDECGIDEWHGKKIILDLDHKNGNNRDNRLENLRFLCPNCHSFTETYKGKNINGHKKVEDDDLYNAYKKTGNIRQALFEVGLSAKGGNYFRIKRIISERET